MAIKHLSVEYSFDEEYLKRYCLEVMQGRVTEAMTVFQKLWAKLANMIVTRSACWQVSTTQSADVLSWTGEVYCFSDQEPKPISGVIYSWMS